MDERDVPECPISTVALREWVRQGVIALASGKHPELTWNAHWDDIDDGWKMPWHAARSLLPEGEVPGEEAMRPGFCLQDVVDVYRVATGAVPPGWCGLMEVMVWLEGDVVLTTRAPELVSAPLSWFTPPEIVMVPAREAWRWRVDFRGSEYQERYLSDPWGLAEQGSSLLFSSSCSGQSWELGQHEYFDTISIIGAIPVARGGNGGSR